jgi:hypothetical protein
MFTIGAKKDVRIDVYYWSQYTVQDISAVEGERILE